MLLLAASYLFYALADLRYLAFIGATTFGFSALGVRIGNVFGSKFEKKAQLCGGIILILLGLKILLEHLGIPG
jgi:putative Mn2+ efflux pump MntP